MNTQEEMPRLEPGAVEEAELETVAAPVMGDEVFRDEGAEELEEERERERAFAMVHEWKGRPLRAFSISRKSCWLQQRLAMGAPDLRACLADLDGFLADAGRILWLCSVGPEEFAVARQDPVRMQTAVDGWMDEHIDPGEQAEATLVAFRVYSAAVANRHIPAPVRRRSGDEPGKTPTP
jgi:hypothetical protein